MPPDAVPESPSEGATATPDPRTMALRRIERIPLRAGAVLLWRHPLMAEEFHALRANLAVLESRDAVRAIVLTSCHHQEGKTTTSFNLALAMARNRDRRILYLEGDLRRPRLRVITGIASHPGLDDYLDGKCGLEECLVYTEAENLFLLPVRSGRSDAIYLLEQERMKELVRRLRGMFDYIICDASPLLSTADPILLGNLMDGLVLVIGAETTQRESIEHAVGLVAQAGVSFRGFILNRTHFYLPRYLYRYQYYHDRDYRYYQSASVG
ncbi:MAG: CpsD/CapB family tyrosine-protein kinase [Planctomycetota bacterium]